MQQALANLIVNAIHATKSGGHVEVTVRTAPLGADVIVGGRLASIVALGIRSRARRHHRPDSRAARWGTVHRVAADGPAPVCPTHASRGDSDRHVTPKRRVIRRDPFGFRTRSRGARQYGAEMSETAIEKRDRQSIVLVSSSDRRNHAAVVRAASLASLADADLRVVVCATRGTDTRWPVDARTTIPLRDTFDWIKQLLPDAPFEIRVGAPIAVAREQARDQRVHTVVLGGADVGRPDLVVAIAAETGTPILVARRAGARPRVLAATDLEDAALPVLSEASRFASTTDAELFAVHNVARAVVAPLSPFGNPVALEPAPDVSLSRERLSAAIERVHPEALSMVCDALDTARLVVEVADALRADAIAVGCRSRGRIRALLAPSVPERVLAQAKTSVLVVPTGSPSTLPTYAA
jgi:nucleotide-binding universal stress UspA family protein